MSTTPSNAATSATADNAATFAASSEAKPAKRHEPCASRKLSSPKPHTEAFWETLVRRGAQPEQVAPLLPDLAEFEIAAEMTKARQRLAEEARKAQTGSESEKIAAGPSHREKSCWGYRVSGSRGIRR